MKYLFTYAYKGKNQGKTETGNGSVEITLHGSDRITPKVIKSACDIVEEDLNAKGIQIDVIAPMGWFKYDGEGEDTFNLCNRCTNERCAMQSGICRNNCDFFIPEESEKV